MAWGLNRDWHSDRDRNGDRERDTGGDMDKSFLKLIVKWCLCIFSCRTWISGGAHGPQGPHGPLGAPVPGALGRAQGASMFYMKKYINTT